MTDPLLPRLKIYLDERFPPKKTAPLLLVFSGASVSLSAVLADRPLPAIWAFIAAFVAVFLIFFQLRVCDEIKDSADDAMFRPERPIPRGLITLRTVVLLGIATVPLTVLAVWLWNPPALFLLVLVWVWLTAMTFEFGRPEWLKARPVIYLVSHMAIMPLIVLLLTGMEWMSRGGPALGLALFLLLGFLNGVVLELGRKIWAPESERAGVETYSELWGPRRATMVWIGVLSAAFLIMIALGALANAFWSVTGVGAIAVFLAVSAALAFMANPTQKAEKRVDLMAGIWVLISYLALGLLPVIERMLA